MTPPRAGKIINVDGPFRRGTPDALQWFMAAIFQNSQLIDAPSTLRPTLRLVRRERQQNQIPRERPVARKGAAVMAYLGPQKNGSQRLLRKAKEAARESGGDFIAVYVDTPRIFHGVPNARALIDDLILAGALGARIVWLESSDPAAELLKLAAKCGVSRIFVARSEPSLLRSSVYEELLQRGEGFSIDVVGFERSPTETQISPSAATITASYPPLSDRARLDLPRPDGRWR